MPLYLFKPVVWNGQRYQRPGGGPFTSGYPEQHGFGHEEWNNSDRLEYEEDGRRFRVFHTEGFGNQPLSAHDGDIVVLMISSHLGKQYLVAIAGGATNLFDKEAERLRLARQLRIADFWKDLWKVDSIRRRHRNDEQRLKKFWRTEAGNWFAVWKCPAELYLGLKQPLLLHPEQITGRQRLIVMYSSYQRTDRATVLRIIDQIPSTEGAPVARLKALCSGDEQDIRADIEEIESKVRDKTTRSMLINARLGQGQFREELLRIWDGTCAVTGCKITEILRASHVKPWCKCSNKERLDPENGLLLTAHIDALFDCGLISFQDNGTILISDKVPRHERETLGLGSGLRKAPTAALRRFLSYHRQYVARALGH